MSQFKFFGVVGGVLAAMTATADVRLPSIYQSGMVLQQGSRSRIAGMAAPGEKVTVRIGGRTARGVADVRGRWEVRMRMPKAGGPYTLEAQGERGNPVRLEDVLVGEVWICSGQSNMEWAASYFGNRPFSLGPSDFPSIRLFQHERVIGLAPADDAKGTGWQRATAETARTFSIVGFLFGRKLHEELKVPIGVIQSAWGGTPAESWIDASVRDIPSLATFYDQFQRAQQPPTDVLREYEQKVAEVIRLTMTVDPSFAAWAKDEAASSDWKPLQAPGNFEPQIGVMDGIVWARRAVEIPAGLAGKDLTIELGPIDDYDITYFNGERIGSIGPETKTPYAVKRAYTIPGNLVKAGRNLIAVRVVDDFGRAGFMGTPAEFRIGDGREWISLAGAWEYRIETDFGPDAAKYRLPASPFAVDNPWLPTGLFNGMISPLLHMSVGGAIWYQGESNVGRAPQYAQLFPAMIESWRRAWKQPELPFYFVQLAGFGGLQDGTTPSGWADLREAQTAALKLRATGMAVAIDAGEAADIHPLRKDVVAERLARAALAQTYRKRIAYEGPVPTRFEYRGGEVRVHFRAAKGLRADGPALKGFAIAGADGKFVVANARITGTTVVLTAPGVSAPKAVRYGWGDFIEVNLVNGDGLPAAPFRTGP